MLGSSWAQATAGGCLTHNEARLVLTEYAHGRLDSQGAHALEGHVAACVECRGALAALRALERELAEHGEAALSEHPVPEKLVRFAVNSSRIAVPELARLAAHVRACPTCEREVELTRGADAWRAPWWRSFARAWQEAQAGPWGMLAPAMAVIALVLAWPAWLGVRELPNVRRAQETATHDAAQLQREVVSLREVVQANDAAASWSGGARALAFPALRRGVPPEPPELRVVPGQPHVPVYVAFDPRDAGDPAALAIVILRAGTPGEVFQLEGAAADLWDPAVQGLSLLLPARVLEPGDFRLEVRVPGEERPRYASPFRVLPVN